MSYTCLVIDDEPLARELIETYLASLPEFEIVASCASAIEASTILTKTKIDLLFLDIEMPLLKGTDFFKNLMSKPQVIFTTAYRDYALDGFELNAVDYLLKPIFYERFFSAIQKFLALKTPSIIQSPTNENSSNQTDYVFVNKSKKQYKVLFNDVLYVESLKDYIKIHLIDNNTIVVKESTSGFKERIDARFIRIHRSYIVNHDKITAFTKSDIEIGKIEIPIGNSYKANFDVINNGL